MTGLKSGSVNSKTGPLVQAYFLHPDLSPLDAVRTGDDARICGSCRHRGRIVETESGPINVERSCYVQLWQGPRVVYGAYQRGIYPPLTPEVARGVLKGHVVRIGAYGDPASLPPGLLDIVMAETAGHTGYTHAWRERPDLKAWTMASCDTPEERALARSLGYRTFRVRDKTDPVLKGEGQCPASHEMGRVTTCKDCRLCNGTRGGHNADITILIHGTGAGHYRRTLTPEIAA